MQTPDDLNKSITGLKRRLMDVEAFDPRSVMEQHSIPHVRALAASIEEALKQAFGIDTPDYKRYEDAAYFDNGPFNYTFAAPIEEVWKSLSRSKDLSIALLKQAIETLKERLEENCGSGRENGVAMQKSRKIFLVHGHDEGALESVARFLERLTLEPIILSEKSNKGRTLIEKVEAHGDVGFAVVLLTPDDIGSKKGEQPTARARQNVIFELGYFIARLGRERVCALKRSDLENPSDIDGIAYVSYDNAGAWKLALARELSDTGYSIDINAVMR